MNVEAKAIWIFNAGSTSLKAGLFQFPQLNRLLSVSLDWPQGDRKHAQALLQQPNQPAQTTTVDASTDEAAVQFVLQAAPPSTQIVAVAHRIVHGGPYQTEPVVRIDPRVKQQIQHWGRLAPLHNPPALRMIEVLEQLYPTLPQFAAWDTAFFAHLPEYAATYALPYDRFFQRGWRRIGFHGLSHGWCLERSAELLGKSPDSFRLITCHLGGGCSVAAVDHGRPVGTTLGFSALEGLPMATRSGSVDPGLLLALLESGQETVSSLQRLLYHESGLLGLSGVSSHFSDLWKPAEEGHRRCQLAIEVFVDRVAMAVAGFTTRMGGLDVLVFTDRIGNKDARFREAVCRRLSHLGVRLDQEKNQQAVPDCAIQSADSQVQILVLETQEELYIARQVVRLWHENRWKMKS